MVGSSPTIGICRETFISTLNPLENPSFRGVFLCLLFREKHSDFTHKTKNLPTNLPTEIISHLGNKKKSSPEGLLFPTAQI